MGHIFVGYETDALLTVIGAAGELDKWTGSAFTFAVGKPLFYSKTVVQRKPYKKGAMPSFTKSKTR